MTDYRDNFEKIFGDKKPKGGRYVWDVEKKKFIPYGEYVAEARRKTPDIINDIEPFVSPVDGTVINSRSDLRSHNKRHGVTNPRDYGEDWFKRKARERAIDADMSSQKNIRARRAALIDSMERVKNRRKR